MTAGCFRARDDMEGVGGAKGGGKEVSWLSEKRP